MSEKQQPNVKEILRSRIYVVSEYDMIEYVGLDLKEAVRSAIRHDIPNIKVWVDGRCDTKATVWAQRDK